MPNNFADRKCIDKDIYSSTNPRVFAQGGNYYVPDGVTEITIEAYWGDAFYVRNDGGFYDRVNITEANTGSAFAPAGTRETLGNGQTVYTTKIRDVIDNITQKKITSLEAVLYAFSVSGRVAASFLTTDMPAYTTTEELLHAFDSLIGMIRKASEVKQSLETFFKDDEWQISREFIPELIELFEEQIDTDALASYAAQLREHYASLRTVAFCDCIAHTYDCVKVAEQEGILKTYSEWFPALDCYSMPIQSLSDQISQCQNIESLQSWMRFASIDQQCSDHEMKDYLAFIESQHIAPNEIVPIYRRSFLTKWLMDTLVLENVPYLQNFQSYAHEKVISDFKDKDSNQLQIAQARLIDILSHEKPSGINRLASAMDEVTILRREAEKKRRITPLRI